MSGVKHTRGPWEVHSFDGQELNVIPDPDSGHPDTYLGVCTINTWPGERSTRRNEANARLIAAAPDLLAAVWALVEHFERVDGDERHKAVIAIGTAAIAKATAGETRNAEPIQSEGAR